MSNGGRRERNSQRAYKTPTTWHWERWDKGFRSPFQLSEH